MAKEMGAGPKMSKHPVKRGGGQGTGHLSNPGAFKEQTSQRVQKHAPVGHPKKGHKANVKGK